MLKPPEEVDVKAAILYAMGVPVPEIAAQLNRTEGTLYNRRYRHAPFYNQIEAMVNSNMERVVSERVKKIEERADKKKKLSESAYKQLQKLLDRSDLDALTLGAIREALDRTEGKSLDRKAILQKNETTVTHHLSDETVNRLSAFMSKHQNLLSAGEIIVDEPEFATQ